jgi:hypothetical protein
METTDLRIRPPQSHPESSQGGTPSSSKAEETAQHSTCWSVIVRAQGAGREAQRALDQLIRRYDKTVTAIIRALRPPWDLSAEELKQEFFKQMIDRRDIEKLDPSRGKFRNWLRAALRNFMNNVWEAWRAEKRGNAVTAPLLFQAVHGCTPEHVFMRQFAEDTLLHALERHRAEAADEAKFDRLVRFLPGPQLELAELDPIAAAHGIPRGRLAVQICLAREKHKRVLRSVVADTLDVDLDDPEGARAVEVEMGLLYRALVEVPRVHVVLEDA